MAPGPADQSSSPADPTRALLQQASRGDGNALSALIERHLPALQRFVRLRTGPLLRQRESVSDLVQSVCRELLERQQGFEYRGEAQFRHWLYTAALNKIREHHRYHAAQRRAPGLETSEGEARLAEVCAEELSPSQQAIARETLDRLEHAMDALPEEYREVILLCRVIQLPHEEVAAQMGRSVDSVRNLLHRALARLAGLVDLEERGRSRT